MKKYLVRLVAGKWEEVTEHVFKLRKFAVDAAGKVRYGDQSIVVEGMALTVCGKIDSDELVKVLRFVGISTPSGAYPTVVSEPETVQIVRGNSTTLHVLKTGENWTKRTSKSVQSTPAKEECKAA